MSGSDTRRADPTGDPTTARIAADPDPGGLDLSDRRPRLLLLSMYPLDRGAWGPVSRITHLRDEMSRLVDLDVLAGDRRERRARLARYAVSGRLRGMDGIYVENSSQLPSETDLAFLALARSLGIRVLTYIRDAQYLFDEYYAASSPKRRVARRLFLPATRMLRGVSWRVAYPSRGLAAAVRDPNPDPLLLPPGSPAPVEIEREPDARTILFVGGMRHAVHGWDLLRDAVERARSAGYELDVASVSRPGEEPPEPHPGWLRVVRGSGGEIHDLLPSVLATVQPRRRSPYNDLAVPIKVMEYLSYGRPMLVTGCVEQARIVRDADAGIVTSDTVADLADGLATLATADPDTLDRWSANAASAARRWSWGARARQIVELLARGDE